MRIENINNEIIIHIPVDLDITITQGFIDYIKARSIISKSKATDKNIHDISGEINSVWWSSNKNRVL